MHRHVVTNERTADQHPHDRHPSYRCNWFNLMNSTPDSFESWVALLAITRNADKICLTYGKQHQLHRAKSHLTIIIIVVIALQAPKHPAEQMPVVLHFSRSLIRTGQMRILSRGFRLHNRIAKRRRCMTRRGGGRPTQWVDGQSLSFTCCHNYLV